MAESKATFEALGDRARTTHAGAEALDQLTKARGAAEGAKRDAGLDADVDGAIAAATLGQSCITIAAGTVAKYAAAPLPTDSVAALRRSMVEARLSTLDEETVATALETSERARDVVLRMSAKLAKTAETAATAAHASGPDRGEEAAALEWQSSFEDVHYETPAELARACAVKASALSQRAHFLAAGRAPDAPPDGALASLVVRGKGGAYLGYVGGADGECFDERGVNLGFINATSFECGDATATYLGRVAETMTSDAMLLDENDSLVGVLDSGLGAIKDATAASTIAQVDTHGHCLSNDGIQVCAFEGFDYAKLPLVALYLTFLRRSLLAGHAEDKEHLVLAPEDLAVLARDAQRARTAADAANPLAA